MPQTESNERMRPFRFRRDLALLLFATLFATYAYFWQSRDWNAASRLMLTYSLVDRHQVTIDGLEGQAGTGEFSPVTQRIEMIDGDLARVGPHYYTDKAPGQSFLGAIVYSVGRMIGRLDQHPINEPQARAYWPADYVVTLCTSGALTALLGVIIYAFGLMLGGTHRAALLMGLAYGLATPALVYATLFYGHQASAFCSMTSFFLLYRAANEGWDDSVSMSLSGLLAGYCVVVEYQMAVIVALLGLYACMAIRQFRPIFTFAVAASMAASLLFAYNYAAFGDPLDLGYEHEVSREFKEVHSAEHPYGIRLPTWEKVGKVLPEIVWRPYRGLTFYAPLLWAAPVGLLALLWRRQWAVALVAVGAIAWMLFLNVSYPKWEGGWCTGPRLIVPAIPFVMLLVAGLAGAIRNAAIFSVLALATVAGAVIVIGCVAVGGRFPNHVENPVAEIVLAHWRGEVNEPDVGNARGAAPILPAQGMCPLCRRHPSSYLAGGHQFERNAGQWLIERVAPFASVPPEPSPWQGLQMAPLALFLCLMICVLMVRARQPLGTTFS